MNNSPDKKSCSKILTYTGVFICFTISGFCSLLYQIVWTRLAFAHFGIITPVLSLIISVFMLGLGLGALAGGKFLPRLPQKYQHLTIYFYAATELLIAAGAFAVPATFNWGEAILLREGSGDSASYLLASAVFIVLAILPWSVAMGATLPLMLTYLRRLYHYSDTNFSLLYLANVVGGMAGALAPAFVFIELYGIRRTYVIASAANIFIACLAICLGLAMHRKIPPQTPAQTSHPGTPDAAPLPPIWSRSILFITGFASLGLEVCWARDFTFSLFTTIYAFASILATYLFATALGSYLYKRNVRQTVQFPTSLILGLLFATSLLPIILTDPRLGVSAGRTLLSIIPFCAILGFLTPSVIDRAARGEPKEVTRYYAINIAGSILGPLAAAYILLPDFGIRIAMVLLSLPFAALFLLFPGRYNLPKISLWLAGLAALCGSVFISRSYDDPSLYPAPAEVHRDYVASVVAFGTGMDRQLSVNSIGITMLTTITKVMGDLPMALNGHARSVLDICFGMGTTFRTLTTWNADVTAVDLSTAVTNSFGFFHTDTAQILAGPRAHIVNDDGRRYLMRSGQKYDVITIDPPPPVVAMGSSLLYSRQFYTIVKMHLAPGGILQQWIPIPRGTIVQSVALALQQSFPHVEAFRAPFGIYFIASADPIPQLDTNDFIQRMPPAARQDLLEWENGASVTTVVNNILASQVPFSSLLPPPGAHIPAISDDRPYNEYFFLRAMGWAG